MTRLPAMELVRRKAHVGPKVSVAPFWQTDLGVFRVEISMPHAWDNDLVPVVHVFDPGLYLDRLDADERDCVLADLSLDIEIRLEKMLDTPNRHLQALQSPCSS